jgi:hypothetical protein
LAGEAPDAPGEDFGGVVGGVEFALGYGLVEESQGLVALVGGLVEHGCQRGPGGVGGDGVGAFAEDGAGVVGVSRGAAGIGTVQGQAREWRGCGGLVGGA